MADFRDGLEVVRCDLCGRQDEEYLYSKAGTLTGHLFRVVRCRSCGLIYLNPRLADGALTDLYSEPYYAGHGFDSHVNYLADYTKAVDAEKVFRPEETLRLVKEISPPPARLLDFGCGLGDLMRQASRDGYEAEGFEVSDYASRFARSHGLTVFADPQHLPANRYDIVTAVEVLEHCGSPSNALSAVFRALKPGGVFYYTTANFDGFYENWRRGIPDPLDEYVVPEGHIYFFSTRVMKAYFRKVGFRRVFQFESTRYDKGGRAFRLLSLMGLAGRSDAPSSLASMVAYKIARRLAALLGLRRRPPLPLARK